MSAVEHDKRRREILESALKVFVEEGYEGATFQKIADRARLTRTTLYIYFRSKREIFLGCIKQLTDSLHARLCETLEDKSLSARECLIKILSQIVDCVAANSSLFSVLLVYLLQIKEEGIDPSERILRRVIRLRHILSTVIIRGVKDGEFRPLAIRDVNDMFYGLIESAAFHLSLGGGKQFLGDEPIRAVRNAYALAVDGITNRQ